MISWLNLICFKFHSSQGQENIFSTFQGDEMMQHELWYIEERKKHYDESMITNTTNTIITLWVNLHRNDSFLCFEICTFASLIISNSFQFTRSLASWCVDVRRKERLPVRLAKPEQMTWAKRRNQTELTILLFLFSHDWLPEFFR